MITVPGIDEAAFGSTQPRTDPPGQVRQARRALAVRGGRVRMYRHQAPYSRLPAEGRLTSAAGSRAAGTIAVNLTAARFALHPPHPDTP